MLSRLSCSSELVKSPCIVNHEPFLFLSGEFRKHLQAASRRNEVAELYTEARTKKPWLQLQVPCSLGSRHQISLAGTGNGVSRLVTEDVFLSASNRRRQCFCSGCCFAALCFRSTMICRGSVYAPNLTLGDPKALHGRSPNPKPALAEKR